MPRSIRALAITAGLMVTGAAAGGVAVAVGLSAALVARPESTGIARVLLGVETVAGALCGAALLPLLAWLLLRRVALWLAILAPASGAAIGAALQWALTGVHDFTWAAGGSILGAAILAWRGSTLLRERGAGRQGPAISSSSRAG